MWNPTRIDGELKTQSYKVVFSFVDPKDYYKFNQAKLDKLLIKKKYKKALEFLNKAIEKEPYESKLYLNRANIKNMLEDLVGEKEDMEIFNTLEREILVSLRLNEIPQKKKLMYVQETRVGNM